MGRHGGLGDLVSRRAARGSGFFDVVLHILVQQVIEGVASLQQHAYCPLHPHDIIKGPDNLLKGVVGVFMSSVGCFGCSTDQPETLEKLDSILLRLLLSKFSKPAMWSASCPKTVVSLPLPATAASVSAN